MQLFNVCLCLLTEKYGDQGLGQKFQGNGEF